MPRLLNRGTSHPSQGIIVEVSERRPPSMRRVARAEEAADSKMVNIKLRMERSGTVGAENRSKSSKDSEPFLNTDFLEIEKTLLESKIRKTDITEEKQRKRPKLPKGSGLNLDTSQGVAKIGRGTTHREYLKKEDGEHCAEIGGPGGRETNECGALAPQTFGNVTDNLSNTTTLCVREKKGKRRISSKEIKNVEESESLDPLKVNDTDFMIQTKKKRISAHLNKRTTKHNADEHDLNTSPQWTASLCDLTHVNNESTLAPLGTRKTVLRRMASRNGRGMDWVLQQCRPDEVISQYREMEFTKMDLLRLDCGWLNAKIIDFYLELLQFRNHRQSEMNSLSECRIFSTAFTERLSISGSGYSFGDVTRWTNAVDVFSINSFFFPINRNNSHWTFVHINMITKTISYYDSLNGRRDSVMYCSLFRRWLNDEAAKRGLTMDLVRDGWRYICAVCPKQTNGNDCGVYVVKGIEQLTKGLMLYHSPKDITDFRMTIAKAILKKRA